MSNIGGIGDKEHFNGEMWIKLNYECMLSSPVVVGSN